MKYYPYEFYIFYIKSKFSKKNNILPLFPFNMLKLNLNYFIPIKFLFLVDFINFLSYIQ